MNIRRWLDIVVLDLPARALASIQFAIHRRTEVYRMDVEREREMVENGWDDFITTDETRKDYMWADHAARIQKLVYGLPCRILGHPVYRREPIEHDLHPETRLMGAGCMCGELGGIYFETDVERDGEEGTLISWQPGMIRTPRD